MRKIIICTICLLFIISLTACNKAADNTIVIDTECVTTETVSEETTIDITDRYPDADYYISGAVTPWEYLICNVADNQIKYYNSVTGEEICLDISSYSVTGGEYSIYSNLTFTSPDGRTISMLVDKTELNDLLILFTR